MNSRINARLRCLKPLRHNYIVKNLQTDLAVRFNKGCRTRLSEVPVLELDRGV